MPIGSPARCVPARTPRPDARPLDAIGIAQNTAAQKSTAPRKLAAQHAANGARWRSALAAIDAELCGEIRSPSRFPSAGRLTLNVRAARLQRTMQFLRVVLVLSVVVALGSVFAAAPPAAAADPACVQDLADHDRDCGGEVSSTYCSPAGCTPSAVAGAAGLPCVRPEGGGLTIPKIG